MNTKKQKKSHLQDVVMLDTPFLDPYSAEIGKYKKSINFNSILEKGILKDVAILRTMQCYNYEDIPKDIKLPVGDKKI